MHIYNYISAWMYRKQARWIDQVFLANGLTVLSTAEHKIEFGIVSLKCGRHYSGMVR